jgi:hypothetical protein
MKFDISLCKHHGLRYNYVHCNFFLSGVSVTDPLGLRSILTSTIAAATRGVSSSSTSDDQQ